MRSLRVAIKSVFPVATMLLVSTALAGGAVAWQSWSDAAFAQAKEGDKLVLVDLSAEWCAYCKKMDATTWRDPKVLAAIDKDYIPVKIVDEQDPELAARYRQYGRPAVVILDADGAELMRKRGYMKPQWMAWMLQAVAQERESDEL
ncbi:thioredoxin family protein [Thiolapillus sp.]